MSGLGILFRIAIRNLFASFLNFVIGGIILVGTLLFVVGNSILKSVDSSMSRSITGSVAGNIQIYSDLSKDNLALFNSWGSSDLGLIPDFSKVKTALTSVDNVKTVIPMGINASSITYGNTVDIILEKLRKKINAKFKGGASKEALKEIEDQIQSLKSHVRQIVHIIQTDYKKLTVIASHQSIDAEAEQILARAASDGFWKTFDHDPFGHLEFLENKVASLVPDADLIFLSYIGTDLDSFQKSFDRMRIVDGQMVPQGHRGMLISKYAYENQFKLKTAHRLDKIYEAITEQGKRIASDPDLQLMIKQNRNQIREIILQLDPIASKKLVEFLNDYLKMQETDITKLFAQFFDLTDANLIDRYQVFYRKIAPMLELYRLRPGDSLTIKGFTKSGFVQAINVKVYGTFQFSGLEKSGLAGSISLMDLMTFRDLYGYVTPEKIAETQKLKEASGSHFVEKDRVEAELFGGTSSVTVVKEQKIDDQKVIGPIHGGSPDLSWMDRAYSSDEIEKGIVLNSAVILKDPSKLEQSIQDIAELSKKKNLNLRVISWQKAAGMIGQFVLIAKIVLYFAVFIIFIVALVIINNAVMMATLQRIREIGTMRAIGAQRSFVLSLILVETLLLGVSFGSIGTFLGAWVVKWLGSIGIPAKNEFLYFFFSGPRLYIDLGIGSLIGAFIIIFVVTAISALYPALIATRVSPIQAMQTED